MLIAADVTESAYIDSMQLSSGPVPIIHNSLTDTVLEYYSSTSPSIYQPGYLALYIIYIRISRLWYGIYSTVHTYCRSYRI